MDLHAQVRTIRSCVRMLDEVRQLLNGSYRGAPEKPPLKNRVVDAWYILESCVAVLVDVETTLARYLQEGKE